MSSYASLMVSVDLTSAAVDRVRLAGSLADRFGARLIGIAAAAPVYVPIYGVTHSTINRHLLEDEQRRLSEASEEVQALFRKAAAPRDSVEWRSAVQAPLGYLASQARAADLVIVGRNGPDDAHDHHFGIEPGDLLMGLGRPILLVPPRMNQLSASRILVAWKNTTEARRTVLDSLPLLRTAETVFIVVVGEGEKSVTDEHSDGAQDVAAYIGRHGAANTKVLRPVPEMSVAHALEKTATREGADLIVTGAYGHSRLSEWAFGGVTRDLLDGTSVCCLMSR